MRFYALLLQPSHSARFLRTLDIWLLSPRQDVKRQKTALFYRKRLGVIHFGLVRVPVCFSSGRQNYQLFNGCSGVCLGFLTPFYFRYCRSGKEGFITPALTWKSSAFADISVRDKSKGDYGFIVPVCAVHLDKFSLSFAWNGVCLSLSRHHSAAAAHQIGRERQHWTARYRLPYPTQVSTCTEGFALQMFLKMYSRWCQICSSNEFVFSFTFSHHVLLTLIVSDFSRIVAYYL